jgi:hypothetical protein
MRIDDPPIHVGDLDAFPRLRIEVNSRDGPASDQGPDIPVSERGEHLQGPYRVRAAEVGKSSLWESWSARRRTWGASIRSPMARPLFASALILRVPASLTVGAAVFILVISAGETIAIAAMVFGRTGDGRLRRERQNDGARGNDDRELQRLLLLVFLGQRAALIMQRRRPRNSRPLLPQFPARRKAGLYCPMPGKVPMPLAKIVSITSSAPPAMDARRPSRKARLTGVSFMYPMPPQYCRQALGTSRPN